MTHRVAPRAEADLDDIWLHVAKESGSIEIANRLIDTITDRFFTLARGPQDPGTTTILVEGREGHWWSAWLSAGRLHL